MVVGRKARRDKKNVVVSRRRLRLCHRGIPSSTILCAAIHESPPLPT